MNMRIAPVRLLLLLSAAFIASHCSQPTRVTQATPPPLVDARPPLCNAYNQCADDRCRREISVAVDSAPTNDTPTWAPLDPSRLSLAEQRRRPVFVRFAANWCVTCRVHKKLVLDSSAVAAAFEATGVLAGDADWTQQSDWITAHLQVLGVAEVPAYAIYFPNGEKQLIATRALTVETVVNALRQAAVAFPAKNIRGLSSLCRD
jgi:hypothetical protein